MKHFTTLLALLLSCSMLAQGPVEFPYNPDSDGDDFIGVNDLMALLGEFDSVFSEEGLYLSEDSLTAMYNSGSMNYIECLEACHNLPGNWKMPSYNEVILSSQTMWLKTPEEALYWNNSYARYDALKLIWDGKATRADPTANTNCFCLTKERPKVEYSYCSGGAPSSEGFNQCINEKLAEGWYPLSGFPVARDRQGYLGGSDSWNTHYGAQSHASFWRWVE